MGGRGFLRRERAGLQGGRDGGPPGLAGLRAAVDRVGRRLRLGRGLAGRLLLLPVRPEARPAPLPLTPRFDGENAPSLRCRLLLRLPRIRIPESYEVAGSMGCSVARAEP